MSARRTLAIQPAGKWIEGISPNDPLGEVAGAVIARRLGALLHYLPLSARHAEEDDEYVHQLRVATRRAAAAVRFFSDLIPPTRRQWLKKWLSRIRDAAGPARDDDVLASRLRQRAGDPMATVLAEVLIHRKVAQRALLAARHRADRKGFAARCQKLVDKIGWRGEGAEPAFESYARGELSRATSRFFAAADRDLGDIARLHALRIAGKKLRYTLELCAPARDAELRDGIYPQVEMLQEKLGDVNDHAVAEARFRRWGETTDARDLAASLLALADEEQAALEASRDEFTRFWTADRPERLREQLAEFAS